MRLKIPAIYCFVTLITYSLITSGVYAFTIDANQQEQQTSNIEQTESKDTLAEKSPETKDNPAEANQNKTKKIKEDKHDSHQHQVVIKPPVDAFTQQQSDIEHYLAPDKVSPILVGSVKYLITTNKHTTAINKGVMVLIPDWQQSIASPNAVNQLQQNLPAYGWTTITLHPPHQPANYPSRAFTEQERSTENSESLTSYGKKIAKIMQAVLEQAQSYPGVIIVVAEGSHSAVLLDIYQQALVDAPSAMVMLSSYMPTLPESDKLARQLAATDYPIFDLYLKRDHRLVLNNAKLRKDYAKRAMKAYYRQKQLSNQVTGYYPKNSLTKEIIGWLSAIGW